MMVQPIDLGLAPVDPAKLSYVHPSLHPMCVPLDMLVVDPKNARKHGARNIISIKGSLRQFGQRRVLTARQLKRDPPNLLVRVGNGNLVAARQLNAEAIDAATRIPALERTIESLDPIRQLEERAQIEEQLVHCRKLAAHQWGHLPVLVFDEAEEESIAHALADNQSAALAEWDFEVLSAHLATLVEANMDVVNDLWQAHELEVLLNADFSPKQVDHNAGADGDGGDHAKYKLTFDAEQWVKLTERCGGQPTASRVMELLLR